MRINYAILYYLINNNAKSKLNAIMQVEMVENLDKGNGEKWSERTIYNKLKQLQKLGYIQTGLRTGNSNTYYITQKGVEWMQEVENADIHKSETPIVTEQLFTDDELYILSDGILALMENINKACQLVTDKQSIDSLRTALDKYQELNRKICNMME